MKLMNHAKRTMGIPVARGAVVLDPGQSVEISADDLSALERNKTAARWLKGGLISVGEPKKGKDKPAEQDAESSEAESKEPEKAAENTNGPVIEDQGRGWYKVFVAGIEVSQGNLRKKDAEALVAEYETD